MQGASGNPRRGRRPWRMPWPKGVFANAAFCHLPAAICLLPVARCLLPFFRLPFDFDIVFVSVFFAKHLLPLVVVFLRFMFVFASFILYFVLIVVVVG